MFIGVHVKYPVFSSEFNENLISSIDLRDIFKYQISWKSVEWEPSCYVRKDRQTNRNDEANIHFSQFCEASKRFEF